MLSRRTVLAAATLLPLAAPRFAWAQQDITFFRILTGEARGAADPTLAERLVRATPGVKDVQVELRINPNLPDPAAQAAPADEFDGRTDRSPRGYPILPM